jgi:hypothetical protein
MAEAAPAAPAQAAPLADDAWLAQLGDEFTGEKSWVYLVSFSRILQTRLQAGDLRDITVLNREQVHEVVLDAFENPQPPAKGAGRPREATEPLLKKMVVFQELHADDSRHFHVAVLLARQFRWAAAKRTLVQRHRMVAHFSASHTQWHSAVYYGHFTTPKKPKVDDDPLLWARGSGAWRATLPSAGPPPFDLHEECLEPWTAPAWWGKRKKQDREAGGKGTSAAPWSKVDLNGLVLAKNLRSKKKVLAYAHQHGTASLQAYVCKNQRRLQEFIDDALEWEAAPAEAAMEQLTDWAVLCLAADADCPHGDACEYRVAAQKFFEKNKKNFQLPSLANALRRIIVAGPSKECRVPFLVGPTNTGKSTLVESFDDLYGHKHVFHLPCVTDDKYPLRNWLKDKRFAFWDELDPVELADAGVMPVTTFKKAFNGQWFELRVPQGFHDGNADFRWQRGCVFTNKLAGLWRTTANVSEEDLLHIKSRVELFHCSGEFKPAGHGNVFNPVPMCRYHLAKWVRDGAAAFDAAAALQPPLALPVAPAAGTAASGGSEEVTELAQFLEAARVPPEICLALTQQIVVLGAVHVQELSRNDWIQLPAWASMKEMERRRVLKFVPQ